MGRYSTRQVDMGKWVDIGYVGVYWVGIGYVDIGMQVGRWRSNGRDGTSEGWLPVYPRVLPLMDHLLHANAIFNQKAETKTKQSHMLIKFVFLFDNSMTPLK